MHAPGRPGRTAPRHPALVVAASAALVGVACLVYPGPGRVFVRGHLGDVAAAAFVVGILGLVPRPRLGMGVRVASALTLACAIELGQALGVSAPGAVAVLVGAVADPIDLVMYTVGALGAAWAERWPRSTAMHDERQRLRSRSPRRTPWRRADRP
jgi:hypothetical protein